MTAGEVYAAIVNAKLYEFHADNPAAVVAAQIRRHCEGLNGPASSKTKHFRAVGGGRYEILPPN